MKVIGIVCSPRQGGNTEILVQEALDTIQGLGAETEIIPVYDKRINFCDGCHSCIKTATCHIQDDMQEIYQKLLESDGIIIGTPVYFLNMSGQAKTILDRLSVLSQHQKLRDKVAGVVIAARRVGAGQVRSLLYSYLLGNRMFVAGSAIGYGLRKGDVREGVGGAYNTSALEEARRLGKSMVSLIQKLTK